MFVKGLSTSDWPDLAPIRNIGTMASKHSSADHPSLWHWALHAHCTSMCRRALTSVRSSRSGPRAPAATWRANVGIVRESRAIIVDVEEIHERRLIKDREQGEANRVHAS